MAAATVLNAFLGMLRDVGESGLNLVKMTKRGGMWMPQLGTNYKQNGDVFLGSQQTNAEDGSHHGLAVLALDSRALTTQKVFVFPIPINLGSVVTSCNQSQ